jgi:hypothetical protein
LGYKIVEFQETPNPNAVKCVLDHTLAAAGGGGLRSYQSPQSAAGDPLATALFAIPGVCGVLIQQEWVTVSKRPDTEWKGIKAAVKKVMGSAP